MFVPPHVRDETETCFLTADRPGATSFSGVRKDTTEDTLSNVAACAHTKGNAAEQKHKEKTQKSVATAWSLW